MKEHISPQDLGSLTPAQRENLRSMWKPAKYDHAVASICINAETDEYKDIEFVVGEVLVVDSGRIPRIVLRRLRLMDDRVNGEDVAPEILEEGEDSSVEEDGTVDFEPEALYIEPDELFNLEDCLPLLSIGQMIDYIRKSKFGQRGFKLSIPPQDGKIFEDQAFRLIDSDGETYENEELCDLLWDIFKTYILGAI